MADTQRFRVLPASASVDEPRTAGDGTEAAGGGYRLLDRETFEPVALAAEGHDAPVTDLRAGYLVDAELDWTTSDPTVASVEVVRPTLYAFADEVDPMFEAARETWERAQAAGDPMNTQVLRNTDSEVTGALYVFAESGDRGRFEEFFDGSRPLEPLVDRVNDEREPAPREVFVLRALPAAFTAVAVTLRKGGQLAETMRDTYDCPRPDEPLVPDES
ncbi:hypothetical protein BRC64_03660 [Halobacteriales archaeon QH_10_67_22]|nr:MAG: hypothetical protein BRC64_03660 [Halobacteriales archaeon QH_10_67_22]